MLLTTRGYPMVVFQGGGSLTVSSLCDTMLLPPHCRAHCYYHRTAGHSATATTPQGTMLLPPHWPWPGRPPTHTCPHPPAMKSAFFEPETSQPPSPSTVGQGMLWRTHASQLTSVLLLNLLSTSWAASGSTMKLNSAAQWQGGGVAPRRKTFELVSCSYLVKLQ